MFLEKLLCVVDKYVIPEQFCSHAQPIKLADMFLKDAHRNPHGLQEHDYTTYLHQSASVICHLQSHKN